MSSHAPGAWPGVSGEQRNWQKKLKEDCLAGAGEAELHDFDDKAGSAEYKLAKKTSRGVTTAGGFRPWGGPSYFACLMEEEEEAENRCILPGSAEQSVHAWVKEDGSDWHLEGRQKAQTDPKDSQAERMGNSDCKTVRVNYQRPPPWRKHLCEAIGGKGAEKEGRTP